MGNNEHSLDRIERNAGDSYESLIDLLIWVRRVNWPLFKPAAVPFKPAPVPVTVVKVVATLSDGTSQTWYK